MPAERQPRKCKLRAPYLTAVRTIRTILIRFSSLQNQHNSPLLRLPAELRNQIYAYVLGNLIIRPKPSKSLNQYGSPTPGLKLRAAGASLEDEERATRFLALTQTCRQVYAETKLLPFTLNAFDLRCLSQLPDFIYNLSSWQRNAVVLVHVLLHDAYSHVRQQEYERYRQRGPATWAMDRFQSIMEFRLRRALESLTGAERIVVWEDTVGFGHGTIVYLRECARRKIWEAMGRNVDM